MISRLFKKNISPCIMTLTIMTIGSIILCHPVFAAEFINYQKNQHLYSSYTEFSHSNCLPCHFKNIPDGTDLSELFLLMSETQLKNYILPMLKDGDMPPEKALREILYFKFLEIQ